MGKHGTVTPLEEVNARLATKGFKVVNNYNGVGKKATVCCFNGHMWDVVVFSLLKGSGCPHCSGRAKRTPEQFVAELLDIKPNIEPLEEYKHTFHKIHFKCKIDGHVWSATPDNILRVSNCPKCSNHARLTKEEVNFRISERGLVLVGDFTTVSIKTEFSCSAGHHWKARPSDILRGRGCGACAKHGYDESKLGTFYVYNFNTFCGFGITNNFLQRNKQHQRTFSKHGIEAKIVYLHTADGTLIQKAERKIIEHFEVKSSGVKGFLKESVGIEHTEKLIEFVKIFMSTA